MIYFKNSVLRERLALDLVSESDALHHALLLFFVSAFVYYFPWLPILPVSEWYVVELVFVLSATAWFWWKTNSRVPQLACFARNVLFLSGVCLLQTVALVTLLMAALVYLTDSVVAEMPEESFDVLYEVLDASLSILSGLSVWAFFVLLSRRLLAVSELSSRKKDDPRSPSGGSV